MVADDGSGMAIGLIAINEPVMIFVLRFIIPGRLARAVFSCKDFVDGRKWLWCLCLQAV